MEIGTITIRTLAILLLTHLFTSKKSIFAKISYENKSFLDRNKDDWAKYIYIYNQTYFFHSHAASPKPVTTLPIIAIVFKVLLLF